MRISHNYKKIGKDSKQKKHTEIMGEYGGSACKRMLIVDDVAVNRQLLAECFEGEYEFVYACDGTEAIARIKELTGALTIILLDIVMPNMDGIEVLKWLSNTQYQTIPVVAVTAEPDYQLEALINGAWDFIAKPTDNTVIKARVNNVLGRYSAISHKNTIEMLQKAQMEIDNLVNSIPGGIVIYKLTDHVETIYFSDGVAAISGHTRKEYNELIKHPAENIIYEVDRERILSDSINALKSGRDIDITYRVYHKQGHLIWVHLNATVISMNGGEPIVHAVFQSVSKQDRLYDLLLNETQSGIYVSDVATYDLLYINETAMRVLAKTQGRNYGGKKCYEYMFGRTSPCPFCKLKEMSFDQFSERVFVHPVSNRTYHLKGKLINWCGINAHVEYILDTTEQYTAQSKLKRTQNLLAAALHNTNISVWEYDVPNKTIVQSFNAMSVHGLESTIADVPESLIANGFIHPESADDFRELYKEVLAGKKRAQRDILLRSADGTGYRWDRTIYIPVFEEDGRHLKSIGTSIDITEQKSMEESFQEIENLRAKITDGIMLNISKDSVDTKHSLIAIEHDVYDENMTSFFQKTGFKIPDEKQQKQFYKVFNRNNLLHSNSIGRTEQSVEALCRWKENEYRILQLNIRTTKNPYTGDVIGYTYIVDVNEQRMVEKIMDKVSQEHFDFILMANLAKNTAKMISNISAGTRKPIKEYQDYEKGVNAFCDHFVVEEQQEKCKIQMAAGTVIKQLETQTKYVITFSVYNSNKELRIKRLSYSYLNELTKEVLVTSEDITELMREEQAKNNKLSKALETVEKASAFKSAFLSNMSHDMRTPMNAIIGFSQMALEEQANSEVMTEYMHKINESGHYLLDLINDVLDMAKIENNKITLNLRPVRGQELFSGIISSVKPIIDAKNIEFTFEKRHFIGGKAAIIDKLRIQQIFINLLSNAANFTAEYGRIECIVDMLHYDGKYAKYRIIIRDNGCGMSEEFLQKAFLPFEQEHSDHTASGNGTGLGLPIAKRLIELMQGTIQINSTQGAGTEVILELTTELTDERDAGETTVLQEPSVMLFAGKRVLICEDQPLNREIAKKLLLKRGFAVECADNGAEGVSMFANSTAQYYDAILMDIRMPVMDGLKATAAIRRLNRPDAQTVAIIAMTANAFEDDVQMSLKAGMNAHLPKPIEPQDLYETLRQMLETNNIPT